MSSLFVVVLDEGLCGFGCSKACHVDQAGLELKSSAYLCLQSDYKDVPSHLARGPTCKEKQPSKVK